MSDIILLFNQYRKGNGVLAGDFNCVIDKELDKSSLAT